jgi:probable H4MPT-linked C1 transfer pathway protein
MTGELADCFATKSDGVRFIVEAVGKAADGRHTRVYLTTGQMVSPQVALRRPLQAAASNWHALARFAGRLVPRGFALLIDVGSTTTDIIPLVDGHPATSATDDAGRLRSRELVYLGVQRTPLCAVASDLPYRGASYPLAREVFATSRDIYLILGDLSEDPISRNTADGQPATKRAARTRLGRMICADVEDFNHRDAVVLARAAAEQQVGQLIEGIRHVVGQHSEAPLAVVLSGEGEFLARRAVEARPWQAPVITLSRELSAPISRCAPAHAVAVLAREAAQQS